MKIAGPCKDCMERTSTCHANCQKYEEWSAWKKEVNNRRALDRERYNTQSEAAVRLITQSMKHKRK